MGTAFSASTSGLSPSERIAFWNEGSDRIGGVQTVSLSDVFDAQIDARRLDGLMLYRLQSTPHKVMANALNPRHEKMLRLRYQESGSSVVMQGSRTYRLNAGDWTIIDPHQSFCALNEGSVSHLWLQIPFSKLCPVDLQAANAIRLKLPMTGKVGHRLRERLSEALGMPEELSRQTEAELAEQVFRIFRLALHELPDSLVSSSAREVTARRARSYIDQHLQDPDLSVDRIAKAIGCTRRYVHKVFEGEESVSRYIWNRRLDLCRQHLEVQSRRSMTLTALAFDHGFNSSSHFSRSFRDRFGTSPSTYLARFQERVEV